MFIWNCCYSLQTLLVMFFSLEGGVFWFLFSFFFGCVLVFFWGGGGCLFFFFINSLYKENILQYLFCFWKLCWCHITPNSLTLEKRKWIFNRQSLFLISVYRLSQRGKESIHLYSHNKDETKVSLFKILKQCFIFLYNYIILIHLTQSMKLGQMLLKKLAKWNTFQWSFFLISCDVSFNLLENGSIIYLRSKKKAS